MSGPTRLPFVSELDVPGTLQVLLTCPPLLEGLHLQVRTVDRFYRMAAEIAGPMCPVLAPPAEATGIEGNFFSTFFLGVTRQLVGPSRFMPLYAMVNQGMRAWVTACDNLLDDEYKAVFRFSFDEGGPRMRSVLTLLLSDRVVTEYIDREFREAKGLLAEVGRTSLRALLPSALQECDEEVRPVAVAGVEEILSDIHKRKTGDLFEAPLALPLALETVDADRAESARTAVGSFGLACQIIDDIRDMGDDMDQGRHNLLVSMVARRRGGEVGWLEQLRCAPPGDWTSWEMFGDVAAEAGAMALQRFAASFDAMADLGMALSAAQKQAVVACMFALLRVPSCVMAAETGAG